MNTYEKIMRYLKACEAVVPAAEGNVRACLFHDGSFHLKLEMWGKDVATAYDKDPVRFGVDYGTFPDTWEDGARSVVELLNVMLAYNEEQRL